MKAICTSLVLLIFCVLEVAIVLGCQYFTILGPEWLTVAIFPNGTTNGPLLFIAIALSLVNVVNAWVWVDQVQGECK
jgi:Gpi18-like mannosyltransferase